MYVRHSTGGSIGRRQKRRGTGASPRMQANSWAHGRSRELDERERRNGLVLETFSLSRMLSCALPDGQHGQHRGTQEVGPCRRRRRARHRHPCSLCTASPPVTSKGGTFGRSTERATSTAATPSPCPAWGRTTQRLLAAPYVGSTCAPSPIGLRSRRPQGRPGLAKSSTDPLPGYTRGA